MLVKEFLGNENLNEYKKFLENHMDIKYVFTVWQSMEKSKEYSLYYFLTLANVKQCLLDKFWDVDINYFHKMFRQCDVFDDVTLDLLGYNLLNASKLFFEYLLNQEKLWK